MVKICLQAMYVLKYIDHLRNNYLGKHCRGYSQIEGCLGYAEMV